MPGKQFPFCLKFGFALLGLTALTGCLSDYGEYGGDSSRGIPLSEAMQASASGSREPLHEDHAVAPEIQTDTDASASTSTSGGGSGGGGGFSFVEYEKRDYAYQALADAGVVVPFNGEIQTLTRFTLTPISMENDYNYLGLFVGADRVDFRPGSLADQGIGRSFMFEAGLDYRRYLNPAHVFISPYISASLSYQLLSWDYRNPVVVDNETIQSDALEGMAGYAGFGVAINRNSHLSFFGEADIGGTLFLSETVGGFDNDVFSNYGYFMVKVGLSLKF